MLQELEINGRVETLQMIALLEIIRRYLLTLNGQDYNNDNEVCNSNNNDNNYYNYRPMMIKDIKILLQYTVVTL